MDLDLIRGDLATVMEKALEPAHISVWMNEGGWIPEYMQVMTTVDSAEEAERMTRSITGARLAAYVQIVGPIRSLYHIWP